jgi:uncharacterized protein (DUF697 family)
VASWNDLGNIWNTLRELDVNTIREESERPLYIVCIGNEAAVETVASLLHHSDDRYGAVGIDPLGRYTLRGDVADIDRADLVVVALDANAPLSSAEGAVLERIERAGRPLLLVLVGGARLPAGAASLSAAHSVSLADPAAPKAAEDLARAVLERLPGELHLAAARRLPGLRVAVTRNLIGSVSFSNAAYALGSGLPEQIPILSVPFAAADIFVLTKNQALLVYRIALAYGAPTDFQDRIKEVLPVVGGAYVWRQVARTLIGLIPVWGLVPKVAVSYAGTYTTGVAAWRWYARGELVNTDQLQKISQEALQLGRARARELVQRARSQRGAGEKKPNIFQRAFGRVRRLLPGHKKPPALSASQESPE